MLFRSLVIDPDECIDCHLCEPECPINAIFAEEDLADDMADFLSLNAELAKIWPVINQKKSAPDDAEKWEGVKGKIKYLER